MKNFVFTNAGQHLQFPSDAIHVSDPCYSKKDCGVEIKINNSMPDIPVYFGACVGLFTDSSEWLGRVGALILIEHCDNAVAKQIRISKNPVKAILELGTRIDTIGVDSGQAGFFDSKLYPLGEREWINDPKDEGSKFYTECCNLTTETQFGALASKQGVVSSSGYGDGSYSVYEVRNKKNNELIACMVLFTSPEDFGIDDLFN
jgi:hypothetical protein